MAGLDNDLVELAAKKSHELERWYESFLGVHSSSSSSSSSNSSSSRPTTTTTAPSASTTGTSGSGADEEGRGLMKDLKRISQEAKGVEEGSLSLKDYKRRKREVVQELVDLQARVRVWREKKGLK